MCKFTTGFGFFIICPDGVHGKREQSPAVKAGPVIHPLLRDLEIRELDSRFRHAGVDFSVNPPLRTIDRGAATPVVLRAAIGHQRSAVQLLERHGDIAAVRMRYLHGRFHPLAVDVGERRLRQRLHLAHIRPDRAVAEFQIAAFQRER